MRQVRNPFRLPATELVDAETEFLQLFCPLVLDILPDNAVRGRPLIVRSAPGGGKTTLLRAFTPSVLSKVAKDQELADFQDIASRFRDLGVIDDQGPRVTGIMISCGRAFPSIAELEIVSPRMKRMLFALLDARIMLGALRGLLCGARLRYPDDLDKVQVRDGLGDYSIPGLELPCSGTDMRNWAAEVERKICIAIDGIRSPDAPNYVSGHEELLSLRLLDSGAIGLDSRKDPCQWLLLLDDVHLLSSIQREALLKTLIEQRSHTNVWLAERLEALTATELLGKGALESRDYGKTINLEESWIEKDSFAPAATAIADRRVNFAADAVSGTWNLKSFGATLKVKHCALREGQKVEKAIETVGARLSDLLASKPRYSEWLRSCASKSGSAWHRLLSLRMLEILIERDRIRTSYESELPLASEELRKRQAWNIREAAELFLSDEFDFPYYFGEKRVAKLGSNNIEQFLRLAGDLFEESLSAALLRRDQELDPVRQEKIMLKAYEARVSSLPHRADNVGDVRTFLESAGLFCRNETYRPNAPYAPGVTGIAISMAEREQLLDGIRTNKFGPFGRLGETLRVALSQNVFRARLRYKIDNREFMVLYLNRIVCLKYRLPLQFGGVRRRSLTELVQWLEPGNFPSRERELNL